MDCARVEIDARRRIAEISPLLFGSFAEHLGRCIYGGLYDPGSPLADAAGFRLDVLEAVKELGVRMVRYPGGNFASGYHWRDGVGRNRPRRLELAWRSTEPNLFGTDEFLAWCEQAGAEPMLVVNLGSGTPEEAAGWVEYCNRPPGTQWSDLRAAHGHPAPYRVRWWGLGNEMDGPWQIGHLDAASYGRLADETARRMRAVDPELKLVLCGSSGTELSSYLSWDRVALEASWDSIDCLSLHRYLHEEGDPERYLASGLLLEEQLLATWATVEHVRAQKRSSKRVRLCWDEWNVWSGQWTPPNWEVAPPLLEENYTLADALVVAQWLNLFLRHCDKLEVACFAQLVNAIAPLHTRRDGLLKQTTFYPIALFGQLAKGEALELWAEGPSYRCGDLEVPQFDFSACQSGERGQLFAVNRSDQPAELEISWTDPPRSLSGLQQLSGHLEDRNLWGAEAVRTVQLPAPALEAGRCRLQVPGHSLSCLSW